MAAFIAFVSPPLLLLFGITTAQLAQAGALLDRLAPPWVGAAVAVAAKAESLHTAVVVVESEPVTLHPTTELQDGDPVTVVVGPCVTVVWQTLDVSVSHGSSSSSMGSGVGM